MYGELVRTERALPPVVDLEFQLCRRAAGPGLVFRVVCVCGVVIEQGLLEDGTEDLPRVELEAYRDRVMGEVRRLGYVCPGCSRVWEDPT